MAKRKRETADDAAHAMNGVKKSKADSVTSNSSTNPPQIHVQIIAGSYERILHGITASIPLHVLSPSDAEANSSSKEAESSTETSSEPVVSFADTFLFSAHASSIRCLALSPPSTDSSKVLLATGSTDARINLYTLSTAAPRAQPPHTSSPPSAPPRAAAPRNKELGSLTQHSSAVTALAFARRTKLVSAGADNVVSVTRTRDWTPLAALRAPRPKPAGRPAGDAAADAPAGITDFAVHPSCKVMVSVGRNERCMRLWNLVTGKRAGVLQFERALLEAVGEGKYGSGEGRCVRWDAEGEEFVVGFERGVAVFGMDCRVKGVVQLSGRTKVQQCRYVDGLEGVVAVSTDDGRICFFSTAALERSEPADGEKSQSIPQCKWLAQLGGQEAEIIGRAKDFIVLPMPSNREDGEASNECLVNIGYSDGAIRVWFLNLQELTSSQPTTNGTGSHSAASDSKEPAANGSKGETRLVGRLLATYETGNRITCLTAFVMSGNADGLPDAAVEAEPEEDESDSDASDEE